MSGYCSTCGETGGCDCNQTAMNPSPDEVERSWLAEDVWLSVPKYLRRSIQAAHVAALSPSEQGEVELSSMAIAFDKLRLTEQAEAAEAERDRLRAMLDELLSFELMAKWDKDRPFSPVVTRIRAALAPQKEADRG